MSKTLKITLWIVVALFIVFIVYPLVKDVVYQQPKTTDDYTNQGNLKNEELNKVMKNEPSVKDYVLTEADVLYISVLSDGTRRDGLAEYFCQHMKDNFIKVDRVKIIQYGTSKHPDRDNVYGILLGECMCN